MSKPITALMLRHNCNSQPHFCNFTNLQLYFVVTFCEFCDFGQTIYALVSRNFRKSFKTIHLKSITPFSTVIGLVIISPPSLIPAVETDVLRNR